MSKSQPKLQCGTEEDDSSTTLLEVCIDNAISGIAAEEGGAKRIELCSALSEGGLTPSVGFLKVMTRLLKIPIFVMIRPRGGDFLYSDWEIEIMKEDIQILRTHGANGFVFGVLDREGRVDELKCAELMKQTGSLPVTFHRAFDITPSWEEALEAIIRMGFKRILTSGQKSTAHQGKELIQNLVGQANGRIKIMAGSGVTPENVKDIIKLTKVDEVHASCRRKAISVTNNVIENVCMGNVPDEMNIFVTDKDVVSKIVDNIH